MSKISRRVITGLPVKQAGIPLPDPTRTPGEKWTASCMITGKLVAALCRTVKFRSDDHELLMGEGRDEIWQRHDEEAQTALGDAQDAASKPDA